MPEFIKTYKCQKSAKKYGLKDIELEFDRDVNFPYYGLLIAEKVTHWYNDSDSNEEPVYEYVSYFKDDRRKINFEDTIAFKLLTDPNVVTPCVSAEEKEENGERIKIERYRLIYFNLESSLLKPTVLYTYNPKEQIDRKINCEYMFVFNNEWIYIFEEVVGQCSQEEFWYPFGHFDNIMDTLGDIKEFRKKKNVIFFNSPTCNIKTENNKTIIELEVFNINGEFKTLSFEEEDLKQIPNSLCSIRLVDVEEEKNNKEKTNNKEAKTNRVLLF